MIKIELIRFEAQDVITASGVTTPVTVVPACTNASGHNMTFQNIEGTWKMACSHCKYEGSTTGGDVVVKP